MLAALDFDDYYDPDEDIKAELRAQDEAAWRLLRNHLEHPPGDPERIEHEELEDA